MSSTNMYLDEDYQHHYQDNENNITSLAATDSDPIPAFYDDLLFEISMPVIVFGVVTNLISLWIWSSINCGFQDTVFLFKALCLSDILFLAFFFLAELRIFHDYILQLIFTVLSHGNRTIEIYATLLLAIARFIRLYHPFREQRLLTRFRLKVTMLVMIICTFSLQTFIVGSDMYMHESVRKWVRFSLRSGPMVSIPALAQNVVMGLVLWKMWKSSRKLHLLQESSTDELVHKRSSHITPTEHEKKTPGDTPMNPQTPTGIRANAGLQLQPLTESNESQLSHQPDIEPTAGDGAHNETALTQSDMDPADNTHLTSEGEPENNTNVNYNTATGQRLSRTVSFFKTNEPISSRSTGRKIVDYNEGRVTLVVLVICLCTFIAFPGTSAVKGYQLYTNTQQNAVINNIRIMIQLLNSSVNIFFYMFVSHFRKTLKVKLQSILGLSKSSGRSVTSAAVSDPIQSPVGDKRQRV